MHTNDPHKRPSLASRHVVKHTFCVQVEMGVILANRLFNQTSHGSLSILLFTYSRLNTFKGPCGSYQCVSQQYFTLAVLFLIEVGTKQRIFQKMKRDRNPSGQTIIPFFGGGFYGWRQCLFVVYRIASRL